MLSRFYLIPERWLTARVTVTCVGGRRPDYWHLCNIIDVWNFLTPISNFKRSAAAGGPMRYWSPQIKSWGTRPPRSPWLLRLWACKLSGGGTRKWRWTNVSIYFESGTKYGRSCNGRRIATRTRSIAWCHLQWSWTTPNPHFKVTTIVDAEYV